MLRTERPRPSSALPRRPLFATWLGVPAAVWVAVTLLVLLAWMVQALALRQAASDQVALRNQQAAELLAARLTGSAAVAEQAQARLTWLAESGQVESVNWSDPAGGTIARAAAPAPDPGVPGWFVRLAPFTPAPGLALLPLDGRPSELQLRLSPVPTWQMLWQTAQTTALVLVTLGALLIAAVGLARRTIDRMLARLVLQLRAVRWGDPAKLAPVEGELLYPIAHAVAGVAEQRAALMAAHAEQMEALRRHAHVDGVTGLPNRRAFLADLAELLADGAGQGGVGLVLLRVRDLGGLNLRLGHGRTDELLRALADLLRAYPRQVAGAVLGRLNGSDFALFLPAGGQALDVSRSLLAAIRPLLGPLDAATGAAIGAVELNRPATVGDALAVADEALARAEFGGRFALEAVSQEAQADIGGQADWPVRLRRALDDGRVRLAEHALRTADDRLLLLDCPLHLQIDADGVFEPASRWLALAARSRLVADIDERAVELALRAIGGDGIGRCVNVAAASLATPGFIDRVGRQLAKVPGSAFRLWFDISEATARDHPELVREASTRWRATGAQLALEHAGDTLARRPQLLDLGLDCVRIDARYLDGIARDGSENARRYLRALVQLVQGVGLQVTAEGVRSTADLALLWALGFDAATGPAIAAERAGVDLPLDLEVMDSEPAADDENCLMPA